MTGINIERAHHLSGLSVSQIIELIRAKRIFGERGADGIIRISEAALPVLKEEKAEILRQRQAGNVRSRASPGRHARW